MTKSVNYQLQTDLFAHSLRSRLMSLSPAHLEYEKENLRGIGGSLGPTLHANGVATCDDMMLLHMNAKSLFGMSYPPPTQVLSIDSPKLGHLAIEMKFSSEPDLSHPKNSGMEDTSEIYKKYLFAISEKITNGRKRLESCDDSDLFFDFDIEEVARKDHKTIPYGKIINENIDNYSIVKPNNNSVVLEDYIDGLECLKGSITTNTPVTPTVSTAYGSIRSSTPVSDEEIAPNGSLNKRQLNTVSAEGVTLSPEEWNEHVVEILNKNLDGLDGIHDTHVEKLSDYNNEETGAEEVANDELLDKNDDGNINKHYTTLDTESLSLQLQDKLSTFSEIDECLDSLTIPSKEEVVEDDSSDEEDFHDGMSFKVGSAEHKIANNKLLTLVSLLEKDRDYSKSKKSGTNKSKKGKKLPPVGSLPANQATSYQLGASPINFSFLRGTKEGSENSSLSHAGTDLNLNQGCQNNFLLPPPPGMKRCASAPALDEIDVHILIDNEDKVIDKSAEEENLIDDCSVELNNDEEDKSDDDDSKNKYRRCSSLKSGKTPPGSPAKRKIVRFADIFGLDLADVKMYLDEVPRVPKSAFQDLKDADISDLDSDSSITSSLDKGPGPLIKKIEDYPYMSSKENIKMNTNKPLPPGVKPLFAQPNGTHTMLNRLRDNKICLETAYPCDAQSIIKGVARVVNLDFHKKVSVRYSADNWRTFQESDATYLSETCDGFSDKFSFVVETTSIVGNVGKRLQLCLRFQCLGNDYWDNNNGGNYVFQYIAAGRQASPPKELTPATQQTSDVSSRGIPITARGREPGRTGSQRTGEITHVYQPMAHSPSTMDDPWRMFM